MSKYTAQIEKTERLLAKIHLRLVRLKELQRDEVLAARRTAFEQTVQQFLQEPFTPEQWASVLDEPLSGSKTPLRKLLPNAGIQNNSMWLDPEQAAIEFTLSKEDAYRVPFFVQFFELLEPNLMEGAEGKRIALRYESNEDAWRYMLSWSSKEPNAFILKPMGARNSSYHKRDALPSFEAACHEIFRIFK